MRTEAIKRIVEEYQPGMVSVLTEIRTVKTRQQAIDYLKSAGVSTSNLETKQDIVDAATRAGFIFPVYENI